MSDNSVTHPAITVNLDHESDGWETVSIPSTDPKPAVKWTVYRTRKLPTTKRRVFSQRNAAGVLEYYETIPMFKIYVKKHT